MDEVKKTINSIGNLLVIVLLLAALGFVREYSYFKTLGLDVSNYLQISHYVYEAGFILGLWFFCVLIIVIPKKFFSKKAIQRDDWAEIIKYLETVSFEDVLPSAQQIFIMVFVYWMVILFEPYHFYGHTISGLGTVYMILIFHVIANFMPALLIGNKVAKLTLTFMFFVTIGLCISAGAIDEARKSVEGAFKSKVNNSSIIIREDKYIKIRLEKGRYEVQALPIPFVDGILNKFNL